MYFGFHIDHRHRTTHTDSGLESELCYLTILTPNGIVDVT